MQIERGGQVPHVAVRRLDGTVFSYETIWQRRNLVLVVLPQRARGDGDASREAETLPGDDAAYVAALAAYDDGFAQYEASVVVTGDAMAGLPAPALLIADRWGEIVVVERADRTAALPPAAEILGWLHFIAQACPECEGETR